MKSLKYFAVKTVCETVSQLITNFQDYSSAINVGDRSEAASDEDSLNKREAAIQKIRGWLDEFLVGSYSRFRHQIVEHFIESHNICSTDQVNYGLCLAFFNCLLDKSFVNFNLTGGSKYHPFQLIEPVQLIKVISERSPNIQILNLSFGFCDTAMEFDSGFVVLLSSLKSLLSFTLHWKPHNWMTDFAPLFISMGNMRLTCLELGGKIPLTGRLLMFLMLGNRRELLPENLKHQIELDPHFHTHHRLQFTQESLTPICSSLRRLKHNVKDVNSLETKSLALLLRHFVQLQKFEYDVATVFQGKTVQLLYEQKHPSIEVVATSEERSSAELGCIQWNWNAKFHGNIYLLLYLSKIRSFTF